MLPPICLHCGTGDLRKPDCASPLVPLLQLQKFHRSETCDSVVRKEEQKPPPRAVRVSHQVDKSEDLSPVREHEDLHEFSPTGGVSDTRSAGIS